VYHPQERWDGTGYPEGLANTAIPAAARIIAAVEAFSVMITDQPKRKALATEEALNNVIKGAGTQFDPDVANALVESFAEEKKPSASVPFSTS
jgi:HD-GYP domain-containing protein (c-di-GMP phosphodiesterase class II)